MSERDPRVDQIVSLLADNPGALDALVMVARRLSACQLIQGLVDEIRADLDRLTTQHREAVDQRDLLWDALSEVHKTVQGIPSDNPARVRHDLGNVLQVCQIAVDGSLPPFRSQTESTWRQERDAAVAELQALRVRHGKLLAALALAQTALRFPPDSL